MAILSVIIVSYNEVDLLSDCLKSIEKFNDIGEELEVIVSDNSSSKNVVNMISYKYPVVKFIHNEKNGGFGYGNNRGVEIATGKYLLFLNPDTLLIEPIFRYAISKFEGNEKLVSFGFKQKSKDNRYYDTTFINSTEKVSGFTTVVTTVEVSSVTEEALIEGYSQCEANNDDPNCISNSLKALFGGCFFCSCHNVTINFWLLIKCYKLIFSTLILPQFFIQQKRHEACSDKQR